jgi:hypothetical protein
VARQKRPAGAGSFFRRADGRFEGRVLVGYVNGKPKYKAVIRKTQREAYEALEALKQQQASGVPLRIE